jgi:hypothetical protein
MSSVVLTDSCFDPNGYWSNPLAKLVFKPCPCDVELFDQNGYDLTKIEQLYAESNDSITRQHRKHRTALKQDWFTQSQQTEGAVLNHSLLFERKGYSGQALEQLRHWAIQLPLLHKVIAMRPKWGLDFSMDYVDQQGNAFEILHWEWDSFNYDEISAVKETAELIINSVDYNDAAKYLLQHKEEWHHLDFFAQSEWKCNYFGIAKERFKMVIWE